MSASLYHTVLVCGIMQYISVPYIALVGLRACGFVSYRAMSAGVYRTVLVYRCVPYSSMSAGINHTSRLSVGVYRTELCLQVYAIQCYVCGHVPYIALVCRCIPYRTEICLQAYTIQCLSAGLCNTALCLRACTVHRACLPVYAVQSHYCRCMRICRVVRAARAVVMHQYHTAQDCRKAGACCTYEPLACMSTTSYQIAGMWVCIIQSYVCRCIPYSAMSAGVHHAVLVCRCMPYSAMSAGMYRTSRYVCRCIPYSAVLAGVCVYAVRSARLIEHE